MIEAEIKFQIKDFSAIEKKVDKIAEFVIEKSEYDIYFNSPFRNFIKTDEALRIRKDDEGVSITYKGPKIDKRTKTRKEIKIKIDSYDSGIELLKGLGFFESGRVVKKRRIYRIDDIVICLDQVENLGDFIEIEIQTESFSLEENISKIFEIAEKLGFSENQSIRKSYLELLREIQIT
ncbi:MAG TPA: class IV adenylate cyclase [Archaeoglobaceae archaeon]|nr:class IV adenylate cyclase [Archaeoglobaceae archaeon]